MANEIISINNNKEQILEFTLSIEGLDTKDMNTRLVIHANNMELGFQAINKEGNNWIVKLPPLPILERTAYPYHLDIIADGYHFEPMKGTINVVGSHEVYVTAPKNPKVSAPASTEVKPEIKKESKATPVVHKAEPTKQREKPIEQIARELMETKIVPVVKEPVAPAIAPVVKEAVTIVVKAVVKESLLPTLPKSEPKAAPAKDQAVRDILEGAGIKAKAKRKSRFSIKN